MSLPRNSRYSFNLKSRAFFNAWLLHKENHSSNEWLLSL